MPCFSKVCVISAAWLALAISGCARDTRDYRASALGNGYGLAQGGISSPVPPSSAAAMLSPAAGRVVQVSERRYADGLSQEIVLAGDRTSRGENRIDVAMRLAPQGDQVYDNLIPMQKPSDADIAAELEARFPGMDMQPVNVLLQNRYGPYGLAAGKRGNGERCVYAWQWIDDASAPASPRNSTLARAILSQPQPVSLRVRLCRSGVSADQLASLVEGVAVGAGMGNRQLPVLGQYGGGNDALSAAGGTGGQAFAGYQMPQVIEPIAPEPGARVVTRRRHRAGVHQNRRKYVARRQAQPAQQPQYAYQPQPYAPLQGGAPAQQQVYVPGQPQPQMPMQMRRPVAAQFGQPQQFAAPAYAPQPLASPHPLDQGLPPQAYAGPNGANRPPIRVIPLTATPDGTVYNAPPVAAPAGAGRLLRDPVTTGPGV